MELIEKHILELEKELFKPNVRKSAEKISELLADDFIEFCSSGKIYYYKVGDVFCEDNKLLEIKWEVKEFAINNLSDNTILATYKLIKHDEQDVAKKYSLRSSIWKYINGRWKMIFHQGSYTSEIG